MVTTGDRRKLRASIPRQQKFRMFELVTPRDSVCKHIKIVIFDARETRVIPDSLATLVTVS
jgi:hypothetical protein